MDNKTIQTPFGEMPGGAAQVKSLVGKNEVLVNFNNGAAHTVNKGEQGKDTEYSNVSLTDDQAVLGNERIWGTNATFAQVARPYSDNIEARNKFKENVRKNWQKSSLWQLTSKLQDKMVDAANNRDLEKLSKLENMQRFQHNIKNMYNSAPMFGYGRFNCGKCGLPRFGGGKVLGLDGGGWATLGTQIAAAVPSMMSARQQQTAAKEPISIQRSYESNPYMNQILAQMRRRQVNPYEGIGQYYSTLANGGRAIDLSGGYNPASRAAQRISLYANGAYGLANAMQAARMQNNAYAGEYAKMMNKLGNYQRAARMASNAAYNKAYAKAKAARQDLFNTAYANMANSIGSIAKSYNTLANARQNYELQKDATSIYRDIAKSRTDR